MALMQYQELSYSHTMAVFRPTRSVAPDGSIGPETYELVAAEVPCRFRYAKGYTRPIDNAGRGQVIDPSSLGRTLCEAVVDVRDGDCVKETTPADLNAGRVHRVVGVPNRNTRTNQATVQLFLLPTAPAGIL